MFRQQGAFNRRRYVRYKPQELLECICEYTRLGQTIELKAEVVNISQAGVLLITDEHKIFPDYILTMKFTLPSRKEAIVVRGTVLRTFRRRAERWYFSAVAFQDNQEEALQQILAFVTSCNARYPQ